MRVVSIDMVCISDHGNCPRPDVHAWTCGESLPMKCLMVGWILQLPGTRIVKVVTTARSHTCRRGIWSLLSNNIPQNHAVKLQRRTYKNAILFGGQIPTASAKSACLKLDAEEPLLLSEGVCQQLSVIYTCTIHTFMYHPYIEMKTLKERWKLCLLSCLRIDKPRISPCMVGCGPYNYNRDHRRRNHGGNGGQLPPQNLLYGGI